MPPVLALRSAPSAGAAAEEKAASGADCVKDSEDASLPCWSGGFLQLSWKKSYYVAESKACCACSGEQGAPHRRCGAVGLEASDLLTPLQPQAEEGGFHPRARVSCKLGGTLLAFDGQPRTRRSVSCACGTMAGASMLPPEWRHPQAPLQRHRRTSGRTLPLLRAVQTSFCQQQRQNFPYAFSMYRNNRKKSQKIATIATWCMTA